MTHDAAVLGALGVSEPLPKPADEAGSAPQAPRTLLYFLLPTPTVTWSALSQSNSTSSHKNSSRFLSVMCSALGSTTDADFLYFSPFPLLP